MIFNFTIEDKTFTFSGDSLKTDSFEVASLSGPYTVQWEEGQPQNYLEQVLGQDKNNLLVIDAKVFSLHCQALDIKNTRVLKIPATEDFKTLSGLESVLNFLDENNFDKNAALYIVGGGIVQDIAGLAAALYKRGVKWVFLPTTLLAAADSCIGGKTGLNYKNVKNQLGLFTTPKQVVILPAFFKTLEEEQIKSGLGEIFKLLLIGGRKALKLWQDKAPLKTLIFAALTIKKQVIEADEFDKNYRNALNFGHTLGHIFEAASSYKIPHGQAVVLGILISNALAVKKGLLSKDIADYIRKEAAAIADVHALEGIGDITPALAKDKKAAGGSIKFVVLKDIGVTGFIQIPLNTVGAQLINAAVKEQIYE